MGRPYVCGCRRLNTGRPTSKRQRNTPGPSRFRGPCRRRCCSRAVTRRRVLSTVAGTSSFRAPRSKGRRGHFMRRCSTGAFGSSTRISRPATVTLRHRMQPSSTRMQVSGGLLSSHATSRACPRKSVCARMKCGSTPGSCGVPTAALTCLAPVTSFTWTSAARSRTVWGGMSCGPSAESRCCIPEPPGRPNSPRSRAASFCQRTPGLAASSGAIPSVGRPAGAASGPAGSSSRTPPPRRSRHSSQRTSGPRSRAPRTVAFSGRQWRRKTATHGHAQPFSRSWSGGFPMVALAP